MVRRRLLIFAVAPLLLGLGAFSSHALDASQWIRLEALGVPIWTVASASSVSSTARLAALLAGGLAAALLGPFVAAALGLVVGGIGLLLFGYGPSTLPGLAWAGLGLAAFGNGFAVPGLWAGAASAFSRPRHHVRDALFFALYAAVHVGAIGATSIAVLRHRLSLEAAIGVDPVLAVAAAASIAGGLVAAAVAGVHHVVEPVPDDDPSERLDVRVLLVAGVTGVFTLAPLVGLALGSNAAAAAMTLGHNSPVVAVLDQAAHPIATLSVVALGAVAVGTVAALRLDVPTLLLVGLGFLVCASGSAAALAGPATLGATYVVALALLGAGQAVARPLILSCLLGDMQWRLSCAMAGGWLAAVHVGESFGAVSASLVGFSGPSGGASFHAWPSLVASAALCALGGVVLLAIALPHHRLLRGAIESPRHRDSQALE